MSYTTTNTLYLALLIAIALIAYLTHRNRRLEEEATTARVERDGWIEAGHEWFFRFYDEAPDFIWPAGVGEAYRTRAAEQLAYEEWSGYCRGCGTEDTGRFRDGGPICIDCADVDGHWIEHPLTNTGIVPTEGISDSWQRSLDPHACYIAVPQFGSRDESLGCVHQRISYREATEQYRIEAEEERKGEDSCFTRSLDPHLIQIPPMHGPHDAMWALWSTSDFIPAGVDDADDIPF